MDETIIFPSPTWFKDTVLGVSSDGWLIYGGPSKALCISRPLSNSEDKDRGYQTQIINKAHGDKIVSVDISPEWPKKRTIVAGSTDGVVKQWSFTEVNKYLKAKLDQSHDLHHNDNEEIVGVGYSSETFVITVGNFGNIVKWDIISNVAKSFDKLFKNLKPTCMACSPHLPFIVAVGTKQGILLVLDLNDKGKLLYKVRGQNEETVSVSWCPQYEVVVQKSLDKKEIKSHLADRLSKIKLEGAEEEKLNKSGLTKDLPDDSFDTTIVQEDDTFDIYKDHEDNEFGHKKYKPEEIRVKVEANKDETKDNFLAECLKLKEDLLKRKNDTEESIESLVHAFDKTHVGTSKENIDNTEIVKTGCVEDSNHKYEDATHIHKHLLASIGKLGNVRIWSRSGKLVGSCMCGGHNRNFKLKLPMWATLLWYKADVLLIGTGKSELVNCNPLQIDRHKLHWKVEHSLHKRGLYAIATNAPRKQLSHKPSQDLSQYKSVDNGAKQVDLVVWTISQDRNMICYSVENKKCISQYNTSGGYIYMIDACPYDARQYAICLGDGTVRVWETDISEDGNTKLSIGCVRTYWQNVLGKVLAVAWHPQMEGLLAFSTAESRVGLINTSGKNDKPARLLVPTGRGAVYSISWAHEDRLYACAGGDIVMYSTKNSDAEPIQIPVIVEGQKWSLSSVQFSSRGLLVGSTGGGIALLNEDTHETVAAVFIFSKVIHKLDWHPQQISSSSEESPLKNLIAVSSFDKQHAIALLEYDDKGGSTKMVTWKMLTGHKGPIFQIGWNPHIDHYLLTSSEDATVRVWDVVQGTCTHIFGGHANKSLCVGWSSFPELPTTVLSGGGDYSLRLWDIQDFVADSYEEIKHEITNEKKKKKSNKPEENRKTKDSNLTVMEVAERGKIRKKYLLPIVGKQIYAANPFKLRKLAEHLLDLSKGDEEQKIAMDFIKLFGNTNDLNAVLDLEMRRHLENIKYEQWIILSVFRGDMSGMVQFASEHDILSPFLVSLAPCVSFKYWKDTMQLYLKQIERQAAKRETASAMSPEKYGGVFYRKATVLLSLHDVKGAINVLSDARLYMDAYVLARTRHMDDIAEETLGKWATYSDENGHHAMAGFCYIALRDAYRAAVVLSNIKDQEYLNLSADLAKLVGQEIFAEHVVDKLQKIQYEKTNECENLEVLPTRTELAVGDQVEKENGC